MTTNFQCPKCGSRDDLVGRADIKWDPTTRDWRITDAEDEIDCDNCGWTGSEREAHVSDN